MARKTITPPKGPRSPKASPAKTFEILPTNSYAFGTTFGDWAHKERLIGLLEAITKQQIGDLTRLEAENRMRTMAADQKYAVMDIRATLLDRTNVNIEVQVLDLKNMPERSAFNGAQLLLQDVKLGETYANIPKAIVICILKYADDRLTKSPDYHNTFHFREDTHPEVVLTDLLEIHYLEIGKFRKIYDALETEEDRAEALEDPLIRWLLYFSNPEEEVKDVIKTMDANIASAYQALEQMAGNPTQRRAYQREQRRLLDYVSDMTGAEEKGIQQGAAQTQLKNIRSMLENGLDGTSISKLLKIPKPEIDAWIQRIQSENENES
jgi:predicted transposase/invertase (TIGR01784 family)